MRYSGSRGWSRFRHLSLRSTSWFFFSSRRLWRYILRQSPTFLNLLEITAQRSTSGCLNYGWRFARQCWFVFLIFTTTVSIIVPFCKRQMCLTMMQQIWNKFLRNNFRYLRTFFLFTLFTAVNVIFKLYSDLSFRRLVPYKRMFKELFRIRSLMIILYQHRFDKSVKFFGPLFRLEPWRWITRNQKQSLFNKII